MELSRQQRQQLQDALIAAFPSKPSLEQMLSHQLDENLDAIAGGSNLEEIVFNLIKIAESQGWIEKLVCAAREKNPGNQKLKAIAERLLTQTASLRGLERAKNALERLGWESTDKFAKSSRLSITAVTKFFQPQPIQLNSFIRICNALKLNWKEIAKMSEEERSAMVVTNNPCIPEIHEGVEQLQPLRRQVTVINEQNQTVTAAITLEGDIHSSPNLKILESILREYSGNTIKIIDIKSGSIKLTVKGSQEDIEMLRSRIKSGELKELSGFSVEDIQILSESSDDESSEPNDKWRLVREIVNQPVKGRNLSGADLSDADLSGADLSDADLSDADLSDANLSGANLSGANLSNANLSGANLSGVKIDDRTEIDSKWHLVWKIVNQGFIDIEQDLSNANLVSANLSGVNLNSANLIGANLSGANLRNTNLSNANLNSAQLVGINLSNANLTNARLVDADLSTANLNGVYLWNGNLSNAKLLNADLSNAYLSNANLSNADLSGAILKNANLSGASLRDANLRDASLSDVNLRGVRINEATELDYKWRLVWKIVNQPFAFRYLEGSNLSDANLSCIDLSHANLSCVDLRGANLRGANLRGANLQGADLRSADFRSADLRSANLRNAILDENTQIDARWRTVWEIVNQGASNANLRWADLKGADLKEVDLRGADLRSADLRGANLIGANLKSAYLRGADLRGTNLKGITLNGADLRNAILSDANLEYADLKDAILSGVILSGAFVVNALFRGSTGLKEDVKRDLEHRGAIFGNYFRFQLYTWQYSRRVA